MKFSLSVIALAAVALSAADAALAPGCSTYVESLSSATNPLSKCRVYTALGFPALTGKGDHDTVKMQKAVDAYCAQPACTAEQYAGVYKDLQTNCAADITAASDPDLSAVLYMWYHSPAQREAICLEDPSKSGTPCVITSMNEMIARKELPNNNANEDDLFGYIQAVTPMSSASTNGTAFCTPCNQIVANIFSNYYTKTPAPFSLNFGQKLTSESINTALKYQYESKCKANLGPSFKPPTPTKPNGNNTNSNNTNANNTNNKGDKNNTSAAPGQTIFSMAGVVAAALSAAGAIALL